MMNALTHMSDIMIPMVIFWISGLWDGLGGEGL